MIKINCPNCGAPLINSKCSYCGTKVRYSNEIEVTDAHSPTEILIKIQRNDETVLIPFVGHLSSMTFEHDDYFRQSMRLEFEGYPMDLNEMMNMGGRWSY